jgi:hypothetical protein
LFAHDLFGKPLYTFPDHALEKILRESRVALDIRLSNTAAILTQEETRAQGAKKCHFTEA